MFGPLRLLKDFRYSKGCLLYILPTSAHLYAFHCHQVYFRSFTEVLCSCACLFISSDEMVQDFKNHPLLNQVETFLKFLPAWECSTLKENYFIVFEQYQQNGNDTTLLICQKARKFTNNFLT